MTNIPSQRCPLLTEPSKLRRVSLLLRPSLQLTSTGPSRSTEWRKSTYSPSPENIPTASHLLLGPPICRNRKLLSPWRVISAPPPSPLYYQF